jgi:hypothetical protein
MCFFLAGFCLGAAFILLIICAGEELREEG